MAQVTIYLDDQAAEMAREAARRADQSLSAWIATVIRARVSQGWPAEFVALAGSWPEDAMPERVPEERTSFDGDVERERL